MTIKKKKAGSAKSASVTQVAAKPVVSAVNPAKKNLKLAASVLNDIAQGGLFLTTLAGLYNGVPGYLLVGSVYLFVKALSMKLDDLADTL